MATKKTTEKATEKKAAPAKKTKTVKAAASAGTTDPVTRKFQDYTIIKKRSGRFEVIGVNGKNVNGMDKAKVLVEAKLIKTGLGKAPAKEEAAATEETPAT